MAWTGLTLTVDGQNTLNQAQLSGRMSIKSIVVGDGAPPANFRTRKGLVNQLYEITGLMVDRTETGYMLTAEIPKVDYDYYFREIGVLAETEEGEKLYVYDNCGDDAQYIVSTTGVESVKKRIRLILSVSDVAEVTVTSPDLLYVAYDDFDSTVNDLRQKKLDTNGDASETTVDFTPAASRDPLASGGTLENLMGQVEKWLADLKSVAFSGSYTDLGDKPTPADIGALALIGGRLTGELVPTAGIAHVGKNAWVAYPSDGMCSINSATGYLVITLPHSWTDTMLSFAVRIFNYETETSVDYHIYGYTYADGNQWYNCTALCIGRAGSRHGNLTVRFGHDGSKCVVLIGETTSTWSYVQVQVHDILPGWRNNEYAKWYSGWNVYVSSTISPTITRTITNTHVGYGSIASSCTGNAATATVAASCSGNAATATTAAACSGNAAKADNANYAASAGNASYAASAASAGNADTVDGYHFLWSGQSGQPTWLWGCDNGANSYVWNPANFSVAYAASAGSAANDGAGRNIVNTYLPLSGGTVTGPMVFNNGDVDIATGARLCLYNNVNILFGTTSAGAIISNLGLAHNLAFKLLNSGDVLYWARASSADQAFLGPNWNSAGAGTSDLGKPSYRWRNIYASNATIQTSDERLKTDINEFDEDFVRAFIMGIRAVSYKRKDGDRIHYGMIAQDILKLLKRLGLTTMDFAGFIKSFCEKGPNGEEPEYEYIYSLRYEEFIAPTIMMVQMQQREIEAQAEEIKELRSGLQALEARIRALEI